MLQAGAEAAASALYTLSNAAGTRVTLGALGASVVAVHTSDRAGRFQNIVLSPRNRGDGSYAGATIGPVAGRIADGRLTVAGETFLLDRNDGENTLHGGFHGLADTLWQVAEADARSVAFSCDLPDGLGGFPGNRTITARYTLDDADTLSVCYIAVTDRPTFLNLTNHTYLNLGGDFSSDAYGQLLEISADRVLYNDASHLPSGDFDVQNTPFAFTAPRTVRDAMKCDPENPQLRNAQGFNNAYLLRENAPFSARLTDPVSGRRVTLHTDYPCVVFYSGGFLSPVPGCALALEAQFAPNAAEPVLLPGEAYRKTISFRFDTVE